MYSYRGKRKEYYLYSFFNSVRRTRVFRRVQVCQKERVDQCRLPQTRFPCKTKTGARVSGWEWAKEMHYMLYLFINPSCNTEVQHWGATWHNLYMFIFHFQSCLLLSDILHIFRFKLLTQEMGGSSVLKFFSCLFRELYKSVVSATQQVQKQSATLVSIQNFKYQQLGKAHDRVKWSNSVTVSPDTLCRRREVITPWFLLVNIAFYFLSSCGSEKTTHCISEKEQHCRTNHQKKIHPPDETLWLIWGQIFLTYCTETET